MSSPISGPRTDSSGARPGKAALTRTPNWVSAAATSAPMQPIPTTTARTPWRAAKRRSWLAADQNEAAAVPVLAKGSGRDAAGHSRPEDHDGVFGRSRFYRLRTSARKGSRHGSRPRKREVLARIMVEVPDNRRNRDKKAAKHDDGRDKEDVVRAQRRPGRCSRSE